MQAKGLTIERASETEQRAEHDPYRTERSPLGFGARVIGKLSPKIGSSLLLTEGQVSQARVEAAVEDWFERSGENIAIDFGSGGGQLGLSDNKF